MIPPPDIPGLATALASSTLNHALAQLGDRWTQALILEAYLRVRRFDQFQARLGIPRQTLQARLRELVGHGILELRRYQERPPRDEYRLTRKGLELYPHVLLARQWEFRWGRPSKQLPRVLVHRRCGHVLEPVLICGHCDEAVHARSIRYALDAVSALPPLTAARSRRWAGSLPGKVTTDVLATHGIISLVADRWAMLTIAAVLLGCQRFDELMGALGISTSVLTARLAMLAEHGLLTKTVDPADAKRFLYRLTPAALDLFAYMVTLVDWAEAWHFRAQGSIRLMHPACGHEFLPRVVCSACRAPVDPREVDVALTAGQSANVGAGRG